MFSARLRSPTYRFGNGKQDLIPALGADIALEFAVGHQRVFTAITDHGRHTAVDILEELYELVSAALESGSRVDVADRPPVRFAY